MKPKQQKLLFFLFILVTAGLFIFPFVSGWSPFDFEEKIHIVSGDLIKNFKFDNIDGESIDLNGYAHNKKLVFENEPLWTLQKEDVESLYSMKHNNTVYMYYKVPMTQKINIYTNVQLQQACSVLRKTSTRYKVGHFEHWSWGDNLIETWDQYIWFKHYYFGDNIKTYNQKYNDFSGTVEMSFDIQETPLPNIFKDEDGRDVRKKFDYIAISSAGVTNTIHGKLSDDVPSFVGIEPKEYDSGQRSDVTEGDKGDTLGFGENWDPNPTLGKPFKSTTFDGGIQPQTIGSSLNPTEKDGSPIWDPKNENKSMSDCKLRYRLGSISPIVREYSQQLTYNYEHLKLEDELRSVIPWVISPGVSEEWDLQKSVTKPVALHVTNRYIQTEVEVTFNIWTAYEIEPLETEEDNVDLEEPEEYYDELTWASIVDGFGGGETYSGGYAFTLFGEGRWIFWIIAIIGIIVFIKWGLPLILKKVIR